MIIEDRLKGLLMGLDSVSRLLLREARWAEARGKEERADSRARDYYAGFAEGCHVSRERVAEKTRRAKRLKG